MKFPKANKNLLIKENPCNFLVIKRQQPCSDLSVATAGAVSQSVSQLLEDRTGLARSQYVGHFTTQGQGWILPPPSFPFHPPSLPLFLSLTRNMFYDNSRN